MKFILLISTLLACGCAQKARQSWTFTRTLSEAPRGGTTMGVPVTIDSSISSHWNSLQEPGLSSYEKDRRAILALQGSFKAKFEFIETFSPQEGKSLDAPYLSWGTEKIFVIEERPNFISLQHIMVMSFVDPKTKKTRGPFVMKHWRQDWQWQPRSYFVYRGQGRYSKENLNPKKGQWLWSVSQVDDSPRYEGLGKWEHNSNTSIFKTERLHRPLPRRERSVRKDYDQLVGEDQLVLTPTHWYHEQKNWKLKGSITSGQFLARELGHNSYQRIKKFDHKIADDYWNKTEKYWKVVRKAWSDIKAQNRSFQILRPPKEQPLFVHQFKNAEDTKIQSLGAEARTQLVKKLINKYVKK